MTYSTNKDERSTMPDPELNPLINPLLAAHMGRWAEVYFTSPPEKREQAVSELLRELEKDKSPQLQPVPKMPVLVPRMPAPVTSMDNERMDDEEAHGEQSGAGASSTAEAGEVCRTCSNCAHNNEAGQRFCGMCGSPLQSQQRADSNPSDLHEEDLYPINPDLVDADLVDQDQVDPHPVDPQPVAEDMPVSEITWSQPSRSNGDSVEYGDNPVEYGREYAASPQEGSFPVETDNAAEPAWRLPEQDLPNFAVESPSVPYHYRLYIGIVLAISLGALLYMAWRGTQALSGVQSPPSRVMPAVRPEAPVPAPAAAPQTSGAVLPVEKESNPAAPVAAAPVSPSPAAAPVAGKNRAESVPQAVRGERHPTVSPRPVVASRKDSGASPRPASRIAPVTTNSGAATLEAGGREELATAETYLGGSQGRNSREAAQWLWKAVGKGNVAATIELSDLYLRGDGVPKNCDQARLLLDAAARKGGKSAGERLRNLQAFGCQ